MIPSQVRSGWILLDGDAGKFVLVYLIASRSRTLYCGVTNSIRRRTGEHKGGFGGFNAKYNCGRLVWFEEFQSINNAIARAKQIKRWRREKKVALIERENPTWEDLSAKWW